MILIDCRRLWVSAERFNGDITGSEFTLGGESIDGRKRALFCRMLPNKLRCCDATSPNFPATLHLWQFGKQA